MKTEGTFLDSLRLVIDYLIGDEQAHWLAHGQPHAHIYNSVRHLAEWLKHTENDSLKTIDN